MWDTLWSFGLVCAVMMPFTCMRVWCDMGGQGMQGSRRLSVSRNSPHVVDVLFAALG